MGNPRLGMACARVFVGFHTSFSHSPNLGSVLSQLQISIWIVYGYFQLGRGYFRLVIVSNSLFSRCTLALRPTPSTPITASFFLFVLLYHPSSTLGLWAVIFWAFALTHKIPFAVEASLLPPSIHSELLRNHGHQDYKEIGKTKQVILLIGGYSFHIEAGTYLSDYNIFNNGFITIIYHNRNINVYLQTNCKC